MALLSRARAAGKLRSVMTPLGKQTRTHYEWMIHPRKDGFDQSVAGVLHGVKPLSMPFCSGLSARETWSAMAERDSKHEIVDADESRMGILSSGGGIGVLGSGARSGMLGTAADTGILSSDSKRGSLGSGTKDQTSDSSLNTGFSDSDLKNGILDSAGILGADGKNVVSRSDATRRVLGSDASYTVQDSESANGILGSDHARNRRLRKLEHPSWPEWKLFLEHLKSFEEPGVCDDECEVFNSDSTLLKHAIVKFARIHESIIQRLPLSDLSILVNHEFCQNDARTIGAVKRLRFYLQMKESNVLPSDHNHLVSARLKDVMRLIYKAIAGFRIYFVGGKNSDTKHAVLRLLKALVSLSGGAIHDAPRKKDQVIEKGDEIGSIGDGCSSFLNRGPIEMTCSRCSGVNMSTKEFCLQCNETGYLRVQDEGCIGKNRSEMGSFSPGEDPEPRKFQSIKERVDARKARLERERIQKEAAQEAAAVSALPIVSTGFEEVDQKMHNATLARSFQALDAIVDTVDSDDDLAASQCNGQRASLPISDKMRSKRLPLSRARKGNSSSKERISAQREVAKSQRN